MTVWKYESQKILILENPKDASEEEEMIITSVISGEEVSDYLQDGKYNDYGAGRKAINSVPLVSLTIALWVSFALILK